MRRNTQPIRRRKRLFIMPEKSTSKHIKKALKAKYAAYTDNKIEIIIFMSVKSFVMRFGFSFYVTNLLNNLNKIFLQF